MREPNSVAGDIEKTTGRNASRPAVLITLEEKSVLVWGYDDPTPPPRRSRAAQREREHFLHPASHSFHLERRASVDLKRQEVLPVRAVR